MTQCQLAKMIGITQQSLSSIEAGKTKGTSKIIELADALKCTAQWLYYGDGKK